jgi:Spy/CpxP family protein refolding chaperone
MKTRTSALAVIIAVFLIGSLVGIAGYHFYERNLSMQSAVPDSTGVQRHGGRLADQLQLSEVQKAQLNAILEDSRRKIDAGMQSIRNDTNEKIRAILNDEQKKSFQRILTESGSHQQPDGRGHGHGRHER